jgi:hypothetical protein
VYLSLENGRLGGVIATHDRNYVVSTDAAGTRIEYKVERTGDLASETEYSCGTEALRLPNEARERKLRAEAVLAPSAVVTKPKNYSAIIAVETDNELRARFASAAALSSYVANAIGAASAVYAADLNTYLAVGDVFTYEGVSDPWNVTAAQGTAAALYELGNYWHVNRASVKRATVAMLSGKSFGGGIGWIGTLGTLPANEFFCNANVCTSDGLTGYSGGYSVNGSLTGVVNTTNKSSSTFWDVLEIAHEIGHNFNSPHTHCIPSSGYGRPFVDGCVTSGGCFSDTPSVPAELGTIMSYCHLFNNGLGYQNTRLIFGRAGEASEAVLPPMSNEVTAAAPVGNIGASSASVCAGSTGNTLSYSGAPAGATFSWSITNGSITAGQTSATVTYTAGTSGKVSLFVSVLGTNGIQTNTGADVDIAGASLSSSSANVAAAGGSGSFNVTAVCSWRAVSNAAFITITAPAGGNGSGNGSVSYTVAVNNGVQRVGTISVGGQTFTITQLAGGAVTGAARGDANGDGRPDIVWRNYSTGQIAAWVMNGTSYNGIVDFPGLANSNYFIQGYADFNKDGVNDLVWRNQSTGQNALWLMTAGRTVSSVIDLPALTNLNYSIQATGDFNYDGNVDLLWRNQTTGQIAVWLMNGTGVGGVMDLPSLANTNYRIGGAGDLNHDGRTDIVLRNYSTGQIAAWLMNGASIQQVVDFPAITNTAYVISGVADFDDNGYADIVWRNETTGQNAIWRLSGTTILQIVDLPSLPNLNYHIVAPR